MENETRVRAMKRLLYTRPGGVDNKDKNYFQAVYVVGEHIWFTRNAAERYKYDLDYSHPGELHKIEIVTIREAFEHKGMDYDANKHLLSEVDMTGGVYELGELFNSKIPTIMKLQGSFQSCVQKPWTSKDGTKSGNSTYGIFVSGQDIIKWESYHDAKWCQEKGIHTGAVGEATIAFGISDYGYQKVSLLGFKPAEQKQEPEVPKPVEKTPDMQAAAEQMMAAAAADPEAGEDLPF